MTDRQAGVVAPDPTGWRIRALARVARAVPHPDPPTARYLRYRRGEVLPARVLRPLLGPIRRDAELIDVGIRVRDGTRLPVRLYRPKVRARGRLPLIVAFHGGGFVFGSLVENDWLCSQVAAELGAVVASVGYRLAPEHRAPIPFQDCWDATRALRSRATQLGADRDRAAVLGVSAGGTLAALVALADRDLSGTDPSTVPLAAQVLAYPATDLTLSSPSIDRFGDDPFLSRAVIDWFGRQYLPQGRPDSVALDDSSVSPLHARDHTGLPAALILVAGRDPLCDDGIRYAEVLHAAGVPTQLALHPRSVHGFMSMPRWDRAAHDGARQVVAFLRATWPD